MVWYALRNDPTLESGNSSDFALFVISPISNCSLFIVYLIVYFARTLEFISIQSVEYSRYSYYNWKSGGTFCHEAVELWGLSLSVSLLVLGFGRAEYQSCVVTSSNGIRSSGSNASNWQIRFLSLAETIDFGWNFKVTFFERFITFIICMSKGIDFVTMTNRTTPTAHMSAWIGLSGKSEWRISSGATNPSDPHFVAHKLSDKSRWRAKPKSPSFTNPEEVRNTFSVFRSR